MKKILFLLCIFVGLADMTLAQSNNEYKKTEFFVGYSDGQLDDRSPVSFHGVNVSGVYNLTRYVGIKGDFSVTHSNMRLGTIRTLPGGGSSGITFRQHITFFNLLGGVQIKDNLTTGRFKPFVHALIGIGHTGSKISDVNVQCPMEGTCSGAVISGGASPTPSLAFVLGGGLDIRIRKQIQFRLIQVDYNPVRMSVLTHVRTQKNVRIGTGIVF